MDEVGRCCGSSPLLFYTLSFAQSTPEVVGSTGSSDQRQDVSLASAVVCVVVAATRLQGSHHT